MKTRMLIAVPLLALTLGAGAGAANATEPAPPGQHFVEYHPDPPLVDPAGWSQETCEGADLPWTGEFCFTAAHHNADADAVESYPAPPVVVPTPPVAVPTAPVPPEPAPVSVEPVPAAELASTGAGNMLIWAGSGALVMGLGAGAVLHSRRVTKNA